MPIADTEREWHAGDREISGETPDRAQPEIGIFDARDPHDEVAPAGRDAEQEREPADPTGEQRAAETDCSEHADDRDRQRTEHPVGHGCILTKRDEKHVVRAAVRDHDTRVMLSRDTALSAFIMEGTLMHGVAHSRMTR